MCYTLYPSTSSDRSFEQGSYAHCSFDRVEDSSPEGGVSKLRYPHRWFVGIGHECSCGFRHLGHGSIDLGFSDPVDWWDEEDNEIEATAELYRLVKSLVDSSATVDLADSWEGASLAGC